MNVFELFATLSLDTSDYDKGLEDSEKSASTFGSKLGTAFKVGGAAIAAVGGAALTLSGTLVKGASNAASYGDNIDKMSQKMGISAEAYQEWDAVLQHSGTSIESLQSSMKTLSNAAENGNGAFERLGITQEEVASLSKEDLFSATITALQNMEEGTERTYLAGQLLGRGATELGALLNTSAEDTQAMKDRVHELGGVMSDEAVKSAAMYQDSLQDMKTAFSGLTRNMNSSFMPAITSVMDGLAEVFTGGKGISKINEGIQMLVGKIAEEIPQVMEVGSQIVVSLMTAITENLPILLGAASQAIITIVEGLVAQLPDIVASGLDVVISLMTGITQSLPTMIPTIISVITEIVDVLTDPETLGALVDASIAIIIGLANGLITALPTLLEKAPIIIANIVTALVENVPKLIQAAFEIVANLASGIIENLPKIGEAAGQIIATLLTGLANIWANMVDVGSNIVAGIWEGIQGMGDWLWGKITGFFDGVINGVKSFLGIASPSKVFAAIGDNMAAGIGVGFDRTMDKVTEDMQDAIPTPEIGDVAVSAATSASGGLGGAESAPQRIIIGFDIMDEEGLVRYLHPYIVDETVRIGPAMVT